jgi:replicative DNA helicase
MMKAGLLTTASNVKPQADDEGGRMRAARSEKNTIDFTIEYVLMHVARCEDVYHVAVELLEPEHLCYPGEGAHRMIWAQIRSLHERYGSLPTYAALSAAVLNELQNPLSTLVEEYSAADAILRWIFDRETNPDSELRPQQAIDDLRGLLIDRAVAHRLSKQFENVSRNPHIAEVVESAYETLQQIKTVCQPQAVPVLGDDLAAYQERLERHRGRPMIGLRTGMPLLDERLCGVRGCMLLGAAPGMGKSVFCLQTAVGVCRHSVEGDNAAAVLYLSLDMNGDDVRDRLFCYLAGMDWKTYRLGSRALRENRDGPRFTEAHQRALAAAQQKVADWQLGCRLAIVGRDQVRELTAARIAAMARAVKERAGAQHCLIVVDYLQLLPVPEKVARQGDLESDKHRIRIVQQAIDLSKDEEGRTQDAAIAISEARKPATSTVKHNWGNKMEDLMGSARLAYAADAVLLMRPMEEADLQEHYDNFCNEEQLQRDLAEQGISPLIFTLAKGRDGMVRGSWPAEFHFEQSYITEGVLERPSSGEAPPGVRAARRPQPQVDCAPFLADRDDDLELGGE